jgi:replicative DNA helicase
VGTNQAVVAQASQRAEESVIGALMRSDTARIEIISSGLEADAFFYKPYRLAYDEIVERYFADDPIDPLTVAEAIGPKAAQQWRIPEREAVDKVIALATTAFEGEPAEHVKIIRRHAELRELVLVASNALHAATYQEADPEDIAADLSAKATRIITGSLAQHSESYSYLELGRRWTRAQAEQIEARAAGVELGARYGIEGVDQYVKGHRPGELMILGGEPGVGKSALGWGMARGFALTQMRQPVDRRIGTFVLSLEMAEEQSSSRFAQIESRTPGEKIRQGDITRAELRSIAEMWARNRDLPLWVNHAGELRETQIKALVIDQIRRHNVGLVIIDHFRFIKTDERFTNRNDSDDEIVKFLKANLAKELNIAVVCLAHTRDLESGQRPAMNDLRGSKMISAFADLVALLYSPWRHASRSERERNVIAREDYELIFAKVRQGAEGTAELYMDLSTQMIR